MDRISAWARSADGAVAVRVGAGGAVCDVEFGPGASALDPHRLAAVVAELSARAAARAARRVAGLRQVAQRPAGDDSGE
ncbi:hypothetical protein LX15_002285 [Streptoalloteichus tenebrarius]|uniref:YbaB/EbfC DNA-binding family protein n=2 Tax=Streptoalloteichus tenebrarius (strain ATCC 17920 / DSM 40477 / JCM 4838 / CBS 697.72 / NBRC 16177 / NCIMB 11028 / NRRL B-12390 / A12253. 1 / ISP 5477) TaxID=1933 RepID=A0ABT1HSS3_STRSD|nr:hypothetical protein [Streptoalloteichus tenebrarius]BFF04041.1 hypothetical protein GCM10020241_57160 [Streptoalloteichus tenebrarius]